MTITVVEVEEQPQLKVDPVTKPKLLTDVEVSGVYAYVSKNKELAKLMADLEPLTTEVAQLKSTLVEYVDSVYPESQKVVLNESGASVEVSAKGKSTTITDIKKIKDELLTEEEFLALATIKVTDLRKYLSKKDYDAVTQTMYKTARRVKVL